MSGRPSSRGSSSATDGTYKFLHDRVQEAAYSLIPEARRAAVHLEIGRRLVSRLPGGAVEERAFDVATQLNHGAHLITDPREREALCRLNLLAGIKAKASVAYASARSYLAQATSLLPPEAWSARYEDTLSAPPGARRMRVHRRQLPAGRRAVRSDPPERPLQARPRQGPPAAHAALPDRRATPRRR